MSPQSRANHTENTTFEAIDDGWSGNPCLSPASIAEIAWAANAAFALHKIESNTSTVEQRRNNPLVEDSGNTSHRKRSCAHISSSHDTPQPFLSSYGSAFLSGIFADIALASQQLDASARSGEHASTNEDEGADGFESCFPCKKKSRATLMTSFDGNTKSYMLLAAIPEGTGNVASPPSVVSPRPSKSSIKIQLFNDQVRELQNLAFPSLPRMPVTVSSSSCASANNGQVLSPRDDSQSDSDQDSSAYGWFVSTDDDEANCEQRETFAMFIPNSDPALAFKAITAPNAENHDIEVQQALAADTIDDVLGDFF